jgi:hypothetical protein
VRSSRAAFSSAARRHVAIGYGACKPARTESHAKTQRRKEERDGELLLQDEWLSNSGACTRGASKCSEASPRVTSTNKDNLMFAVRYGELYVSTNSKGFSNEAPCVGHLMALDLETGIQVQVTSVAG